MSGVVLRCPNCGTTGAVSGECEACHEAQVRYYCSNHTPGRWLDTPSCPQCGARFGEAKGAPVRTAAAAPTRRPGRPGSSTSGRMPGSFPGAAPGPVPPTAGRPMPGEGAGGGPEHLTPREDEEIGVRGGYAPRGPSLRDLLEAAGRARRARPDAVFDHETAPPVRARRGGCLGRLILIVIFLFLAFMGGVSILGGSVLRLFLPY
jgi:hypothetical protein